MGWLGAWRSGGSTNFSFRLWRFRQLCRFCRTSRFHFWMTRMFCTKHSDFRWDFQQEKMILFCMTMKGLLQFFLSTWFSQMMMQWCRTEPCRIRNKERTPFPNNFIRSIWPGTIPCAASHVCAAVFSLKGKKPFEDERSEMRKRAENVKNHCCTDYGRNLHLWVPWLILKDSHPSNKVRPPFCEHGISCVARISCQR